MKFNPLSVAVAAALITLSLPDTSITEISNT